MSRITRASTIVSGLLALAFMYGGSAYAEGFEAACPARTADKHPEVDNPQEGCACIVDAADGAVMENLEAASSPEELAEATKEIMRACGYEI